MLQYLKGFGNEFESEALPNTLPTSQNNPQRAPYGLYAEQLSGSAFTAPRSHNFKTWLYRIQPAVTHQPFIKQLDAQITKSFNLATPNQLRWYPFPIAKECDFISGIQTISGAGHPSLKNGLAIHVYTATKSMHKTAFYNSDGDYLIVPQQGRLDVQTEMGCLSIEPNEILVIPRGIVFKVVLLDGPSRGYILETYDHQHWELPDLGPIGSNGLANARHFLYPVARYEDVKEPWKLLNKFQGITYPYLIVIADTMFVADMDHSPFNVVGWMGNYAPFKYDLRLFNTINTVSFDHPDPSIFTVLTVKSAIPGVALADFVIFPPKWMVAQHTFRPPYFHRNSMTEFMGLISGEYDAKATGFLPGGASLHSMMTPHGPDSLTFAKASTAELTPVFVDGGIAFMFETCLMLGISEWALNDKVLQQDYHQVWQGLANDFDPGFVMQTNKEI